MKILNFGSVNRDFVYRVDHFLQPGETLSSNGYASFPGGKGFNQSVAIARALSVGAESGCTLVHVGHVGRDGADLVELLRQEGANVDFLTEVEAPTGHAIIEVDPSGQNCILIHGGANQCLTPADIEAALQGAKIGPEDVVLLQNETSATAEILRLSAATGARVVFNAAPMSPEVLKLPLECVSLLVVNEVEGAALLGQKGDSPVDGYRLLEALRAAYPHADILLTLGVGGSLFGPHLNRVTTIGVPARSVRAVDTTAAGDTFIGYFLAAIAHGLEPLLALDQATAASAYCVAHEGASPSIPVPSQLPMPWDHTLLRGRCDKAPTSYRVGEAIVFTLEFENPPSEAACEGYEVRWTRKGDDGVTEEGSAPALSVLRQPLTVQTTLACPGFVSLVAMLHGPDGRPVSQPTKSGQWWVPNLAFDGGAGAEVEVLRPEPIPEDFDAYWERQKARMAEVPVRAECEEIPTTTEGVRLFQISIDCPGPRPVTGFFSLPAELPEGKTLPAEVCFQGYGTYIPVAPETLPRDMIRLEINAHGLEIGRDAEFYNQTFMGLYSNGYSYAFNPAENENPDTAYFNGMALRVMRALQYVKTRPEWNGRDLVAVGGSQGGLQTIWAASLDADVMEARSEIPWCCDLAGITTTRMASPWHIPYVRGIDYFDPVHHAHRVQCPVHIPRAGLGDYTCPPSGIAILYNLLPGPKSIRWVQGSTHGYVPPEPNQVEEHSQGKV